MFNAAAIPQCHRVRLAGTTAICVVMSIGKEGAKQTVLHVEQGHVLVERDFQRRCIYMGGQIKQLLQIEVVTRCQAFQTPMLAIPRHRQGIGDVQGEITDTRCEWRQGFQLIGIANQKAIGSGPN